MIHALRWHPDKAILLSWCRRKYQAALWIVNIVVAYNGRILVSLANSCHSDCVHFGVSASFHAWKLSLGD